MHNLLPFFSFTIILLISTIGTGVVSAQASQSFDDWLVANSIPAESSGPEDRNGPLELTNIEAYAYGLNPFTAVASDLPRLTDADTATGLSYFYRQNTEAADLATGIEGSPDLAGWNAVTPTAESVLWTVDGVEGREAVIPWGGASPQFLRYVATLAGESPFIDIPAGTISEYGGFLAEITIAKPYAISKYEVTGGEWQQVVDWGANNGYEDLVTSGALYCADNHPVYYMNWYHVVMWCNARSEMEGLEPVYYDTSGGGSVVYRGPPYAEWATENSFGSEVIEWDESKNGYRLPTQDEWEYAARGGQATSNYIYSGSNNLDEVAIYSDNSFEAECSLWSDGRGTWPVGSKAPNELGLYDMSGSLWEYHWDPNYSEHTSDPGVKLRGRRASGGSWFFGDCLVNSSTSYQPIQFGTWLGFRLARNN